MRRQQQLFLGHVLASGQPRQRSYHAAAGPALRERSEREPISVKGSGATLRIRGRRRSRSPLRERCEHTRRRGAQAPRLLDALSMSAPAAAVASAWLLGGWLVGERLVSA